MKRRDANQPRTRRFSTFTYPFLEFFRSSRILGYHTSKFAFSRFFSLPKVTFLFLIMRSVIGANHSIIGGRDFKTAEFNFEEDSAVNSNMWYRGGAWSALWILFYRFKRSLNSFLTTPNLKPAAPMRKQGAQNIINATWISFLRFKGRWIYF